MSTLADLRHRTPALIEIVREPRIAGVLLALTLAQTFLRMVRLALTPDRVFDDAFKRWIPIANEVFTGTPLYTADAIDNKPPLFQYLNLAVGATDVWFLWFAVIGAANGLAAYLLYRWVAADRDRGGAEGVVAALLFVAALPVVWGTYINARSPALPLVLLAVRSRRGWVSGASIAAAGLFTQYAALGIIPLVYRRMRGAVRDRQAWRWLGAFVAAGLGTAALAYGSLFVVWGPASFVEGIQQTLTTAVGELQHQQARNALVSPAGWIRGLAMRVRTLSYLLLPAGFALGCRTLRLIAPRPRTGDTLPKGDGVLGVFAVVYLLALGIKSLGYYWLLALPFLAALAAETVLWILTASRSPSEP